MHTSGNFATIARKLRKNSGSVYITSHSDYIHINLISKCSKIFIPYVCASVT